MPKYIDMKPFFYLFGLFLFLSCSKNIEPIAYGNDSCTYCSMTIVDPYHAAQLVTKKGKNYKFDSSECMIHYLHKHSTESMMLHILAADYTHPGKLMDATKAHFLISEQISSPMGAFLSAFEDKASAQELQKQYTGKLYDWKNIQNEITNPHTEQANPKVHP